MKILLRILTIFLFTFGIHQLSIAQVQRDTIELDLDGGFCNACGDQTSFTSQVQYRFVDSTPLSRVITKMRVVVKYMSCTTDELLITLNDYSENAGNLKSGCSCGTVCDTADAEFNEQWLSRLYHYGDTNTVLVNTKNMNGFYVDRVLVIREYKTRPADDAGVLWVHPPNTNLLCPGSNAIQVYVGNFGTNQLSNVDVDWEWNGSAQSTVSVSSTIDTLYSTAGNIDTISLGNRTINVGQTYRLKAWTSDPNNNSDTSNANDTMEFVFSGAYADTLTIGGSSPDFTSIQAAFDSLTKYGVCSPVVLLVRDGTYNEQLSIGQIRGASSVNTITLQSQSNDSSKVVINYSASSSMNYVMRLEAVEHLRFKQLSFEALSSSYGRVLLIEYGYNDLIFANCQFLGIGVTTTSSNYWLVSYQNWSWQEVSNHIAFNRCRFYQGSYGMYFRNSSNSDHFTVNQCLFDNQYYMGAYLDQMGDLQVWNSEFLRGSGINNGGYGLYCEDLQDTFKIIGNKMLLSNGGTPLYLEDCYGLSTHRSLVANNFLSTTYNSSRGSSYGLYIDYVYYTDFIYNNIYRKNSNSDEEALYAYWAQNNNLYNNIIQNDGDGYAIEVRNNQAGDFGTMDHNCYYNGGNQLGALYGRSVNDLQDLLTFGQDTNSVSSDPSFTSASDLHAYSVDLDGNAKAFSAITTDIDGESRGSNPDIGADQFRLKGLDVSPIEIPVFVAGNHCLEVVIRNMGSTTLTSVDVDWELNGSAQSAVSWSGSMPKGDTAIVCLGNVNFQADTLYTITIWTDSPNSGTDSLRSNDTIRTQLYPAMNGIYTIGGSSPDFNNLSDAVAALNKGGIKDSVWFKIRTGTYNEQFTIGRIKGADAQASVIFESEDQDSSKVTINYSSASWSNNYVIYLDNSRGISFRNLSFLNSSNSYKRVFFIQNGLQDFELSHCYLSNNDSLSTSTWDYSLIYSYANPTQNVHIRNNHFDYGSSAIYMQADWSSRGQNVVIANNFMNQQAYAGLYLYYLNDLVVKGNRIQSVQQNLDYGVYGYGFSEAFEFFNNQIYVNGSGVRHGVYLSQYFGSSDTARVFNNMITTMSGQRARGLEMDYFQPARCVFNNILLESTDSANSYAFWFDGGRLQVHNNNFISLDKSRIIGTDYIDIYQADYNNLYTTGSTLVDWDGPLYSDLSAYSSATNRDKASLAINPRYTSPMDLHVSAVGLDGAGTPIFGINRDFDGDNRNDTMPDIGADEFTPPARDAGVVEFISPGDLFGADTTTIIVSVYNFGVDTLNSVKVYTRFNSDSLPVKTFNRTIAPGDSIHATIGKYKFNANTAYTFRAFTSEPNGSSDQRNSNDTLVETGRFAALSGVYTIGGSSPDFATIREAIATMEVAGILDSVRFRLRSGTYNEQLVILPIKGASRRNSVIFESESLDSSAVTISFTPTQSDSNYVIYLQGADGVTLRHLTIDPSSGSSYAGAVRIDQEANNNTLANCHFKGRNGSDYDYRLVYSNNNADDNLLIENNRFDHGHTAIDLYGYRGSSPWDNSDNLIIRNNHFNDQYRYAIELDEMDSIKITGNVIENSTYRYFIAILLDDIDHSVMIDGNRMNVFGTYGIYHRGNSSDTSQWIVNNAIAMNNDINTSMYGIYLDYTDNVKVMHNSIHIGRDWTSTFAYTNRYSDNNHLYNNIFSTVNGWSVYSQGLDDITHSDHNNFFSTKGGDLWYENGSSAADLSNWQMMTGLDSNSISTNPNFFSQTDLHTEELSLNGMARYFSQVPVDIEGNQRDSMNPDIGAYEFEQPPLDAGVFDVITPQMPFPADTQQVRIVIRNFGSDSLKSVRIGWVMNGQAQTAVQFSNLQLATGDTAHLSLGSWFFAQDSSYDFKVWTHNPNGQTDTINANDTMMLEDQYPALSGIYTIGGASPDFNSFADAIAAMNKAGIYDSVRFDVRTGTYTEQLQIGRILGADKPDAIIFQSANGDSTDVVLTSNATFSNNYTVLLDSARGVTFRHMTIKTSGTSYSRVFEFRDEVEDVGLCNNIIQGYQSTSTSDYRSLIYMYNSNNDQSISNITIKNNHLKDGSFGIYLYNYNNAESLWANNFTIEHNDFDDQYYMGLYLRYLNDFRLNHNRIINDASQHSAGYGAYLYYCRRGGEIVSNEITGWTESALYCYEVDGAVGDSFLIANNMLQATGAGSFTALYLSYSSFMNVFNNNMATFNSLTSSTYGAYFLYPASFSVYNNNFYHGDDGYALRIYGTTPGKLDNNNYYTNGSLLNQSYNTDYNSLITWQQATSRDGNSLNIDPDYVSATDLHVRETDLNEAGKNLFYVITTDFDGEARDSTLPDIGADEFEIPAANDAGIIAVVSPDEPFASGNNPVQVVIENFGSDSLKSATIHWAINGTTQSTHSWTGALNTGEKDTVQIGTFNFLANTAYDIEAWTSSPNGQTDSISYNDSTEVTDVYAALSGNYTVGGLLPDFNTLAEAVNRLERSGIIGNVNFKIRSGTYKESFVIHEYPGAQSGRTVTFEAESGDSSDVVIQYNGKPFGDQLVHVKGADRVRFHKLTFDASNYSGTIQAIRYDDEANHLEVSNCHIKLYNFTSSWWYYTSIGIYSPSDKDDSTTIQNNRIDNGTYSMQLYGLSNDFERGLRVHHNDINGVRLSAGRLQYQQGMHITANEVSSSSNSSNPMWYIFYTSSECEFSANEIVLQNNSDGALYWDEHQGSSTDRLSIYNNFFSFYQTGGQEAADLYDCDYVNLYHNTFHVYGGTSTSSMCLRTTNCNTLDIRNNIFSNASDGYAYYNQNSGISQMDYNDLYSSGTHLAHQNGTNYANLAAWRSATSRDNNSVNVLPVYNSNTDLHTGMVNLDSAGTAIAMVSTDIDGDNRNSTHPDIGADEFESLPKNMGLSSLLAPMDMCDEDSIQVKVNVYNYGNQPQWNFPVKYSLNGGTLVSQTISDTLLPGQTYLLTFSKKEAVQLSASYQLVVWTDLSGEQFPANDTIKSGFTNYPVPDSVSSMFPADSTENLNYPITLSWLPANGATAYDLYIWPDTSAKPSSPAYSNITAISQQIASGLVYGTRYKWQVVAKNSHCDQLGRIQHFRLKYLPDLVVEEVTAATSGFSGNTLSVSWKIKNEGLGQTSGDWWDAVYLSNDKIYDGSDQYMGAIKSPSGLNPNQNYNQSYTVTLPNGISGTYYMIVRTDRYNGLREADENNNYGTDTTGTNVSLTPPPDLIVSSIVNQGTGFSGNKSFLFYTVKNDGTGQTRSGSWRDRIYLSADSTLDANDYYLKEITHSGNLDPDSTYTKASVEVTLPNFISGNHYFFVVTDYRNDEYEHSSEGNNSKVSDSINVKLTPPADLVVKEMVSPDTIHSQQSVNLQYKVLNQGGSSTGRHFYDRIYLSQNSAFNELNAIYMGQRYHSALTNGDTHYVSLSFTIPAGIQGRYFWFVQTDYFNQINEVSNENNNLSDRDTTFILTPDLVPEHITVPVKDTTGHTFSISYSLKNQGPGLAPNRSRTDSVFISSSATFNRSTAEGIGRFRYTPATPLQAGDSLLRSFNVRIPDGYDGDRYFFIAVDAQDEIYEYNKESNNVGVSNKMEIILAPYPDLRPEWVSYPDSSAAGELVQLDFKVSNKGEEIAESDWRDKIYLSKDSIFNPSKVIEISNAIIGSDLEVDSMYENNYFVTLPSALSRGHYYFFAFTDAAEEVYEHFNDTNNIVRSDSVFIDGYPPIDLVMSCVSLSEDTLYTGNNYNLSFTVTNEGDAQTGQASWADKLVLSTDSIYDASDIELKQVVRNGVLAKGNNYTVNTSVQIPNGLSGSYYLLAMADFEDKNNDEDTTNNYRSKCKNGASATLKVELTPPPDLRITSYAIPNTGVSGQSISVSWIVKNVGSGSTRNGSWVDQMFLSADGTLSSDDYRLFTKNHVGNLNVNAQYDDSVGVFLPSHFTGNYYLFVKTDASDLEYEHMNEGNNVISSVISISPAPPADLVVSSVSAPTTVLAGNNIAVQWKVKNNGSNPASGWLRDNIYLSLDDKQDASDKLLSSIQYSISLAPNGESTRSQNVQVNGVPLGEYYVLVSTDVLNNINESNDTNNSNTAPSKLNVDVPQLNIGVLKTDTLEDQEELIYRMHVGSQYDDESLLITLRGDSVNGNNQMFVRREALATPSQFDYKYRDPFEGNQEIIIPELDTGTYYLYVTGNVNPGNQQNISLLASILPFEIRRVTPSSGGNAGEVTLKIEGSKFDTSTAFYLESPNKQIVTPIDTNAPQYSQSANSTRYFELVDPTTAYVTFDLNGEDTGFYDITAQKEQESTTKEKGFEIVSSSGELLDVQVVRPSSTRSDVVIAMTILYTNKGNNDIVDRKVEIISTQGAPIALTPEGLSNEETSLEITLENADGPPGRLRAGSSGSVKVYIESSAALGIMINK